MVPERKARYKAQKKRYLPDEKTCAHQYKCPVDPVSSVFQKQCDTQGQKYDGRDQGALYLDIQGKMISRGDFSP